MFLGRENELDYLNSEYQKAGSRILVVYGQKYIGKTRLFSEFTRDKDCFYFRADAGSERGQLYLLARKLQLAGVMLPEYPESFVEIWSSLPVTANAKKIIVLESFEHLVKSSPAFMPALTQLVRESEQEYLVLLGSGAIDFVENDLVSRIGKSALALSGFLKIRELGFAQLRQYFPQYSIRECVQLYAILGGYPGLWQNIDPSLSVKENICRQLLSEDGALFRKGESLVREQLREPAVYYSILAALAGGRSKLNELYRHTQYSRAKISVYLKNLMEIGIVSKVFSIDTPGRDNLKKGIYRIENPFVRFWFCFIYPYRSELFAYDPEAFYEAFIQESMHDFCRHAFSKVCQETMLAWNQDSPAEEVYARTGSFDGKNGLIDFVGQNENGDYTVAFAAYEKNPITRADLTRYVNIIQGAKIEPVRIYVFYRDRIDEEIAFLAKTKEELIMVDVKDL